MASRLERRDSQAALRVVLEVRSLERGGMERVVAELALGLRDGRIEPIVVCTERGGQQADRLRAAGIQVEILTHADRRAELEALLDRYEVQLLNAHYSSLGTPIAAARGIPVIVTLHNLYAWLGSGILDEVRALDACVAGYVAVSESVARFSCERFRIDPARVHVIRNGVRPAASGQVAPATSEADRARLRAELGATMEHEVVVQVGRVERVKCQLALVEAAARLRAVRPRLRVWIVGSAGEEDYLERVRRRVEQEGLSEVVCLLGERSDVPSILGAADVLAMPSVIEGLSLSVLEALRAGLPAVLTRVGDADFLLGEAEPAETHPAGILIDGPAIDPHAANWMTLRELAGVDHPPHAAALAEALAAVLGDLPGFRAAARLRAAALADELDVRSMCRRTAALFLAVAARTAAQRARSLEHELERERQIVAELSDKVTRLPERVREGLAQELATQLSQTVLPELAVSRRIALETHTVAARTLDKLRLTRRVRAWGRQVAGRFGVTGREPVGALSGPGVTGEEFALAAHAAAAAQLVAPREAIELDPRPSRWLFVGAAARPRSIELASALARRGFPVTHVAKGGDAAATAADAAPADAPFESLVWEPGFAERWLSGRDERLRVMVDLADADVIDLVERARRHGARVVYDSPGPGDPERNREPASGDLERQLSSRVDDLVLASCAGDDASPAVRGARHVVPDGRPGDQGGGWESRADALVEITDRLTIAVIVLCYNNRDVIEACVEALIGCRGDLDYEVVVVDNGSTDGSYEWLVERARRSPGPRVLRNTRNGCSSGRNLGLDETRSEMVVFMDSDQRAMRPGWLDPALEILRDHRRVGAVSWNAGWLRPGSGSGTIVDDLPARAMIGRHAGAMFRTDVAFLATSGMAVPRAVLARISGFDDFYDPTCFEDTDVSFQIKDAGYELAYCPWLAIDHRPHATTAALKGYKSYYKRNEQYFLDKWRHRPEWFFDTAWSS